MKLLLAAISLFALGLTSASSLAAQSVVDHLTMNQWVLSGEDGDLKGRVIVTTSSGQVKALANVSVIMLSNEGVVRRAKTDALGEFNISHVTPGEYALSARGDNAFACSALHVIEHDSSLEGIYPEIAEVSLANVDYTVVKTAVIRYMPPKIPVSSQSFAAAELKSLADRVCASKPFRVARSGGGMRGRIYLAGSALHSAAMTNVFVFRDGVEVARAVTNENGEFAIDEVDAGHYSLLAIGAGGIGLLGFEIVEPSRASEISVHSSDESERLVVLQDVIAPVQFAMQITGMSEIVEVSRETYVECMTIDGPVTITQADGTETTQETAVSFIIAAGGATIADENGEVLYENVQVVDGCPGECITLDGPLTVIDAEGNETTSEDAVSFIFGRGDQSIADQDGNVLYEDVLVVDECPEIPIDDGFPMDGEFFPPFPGGGFAGGPGFGGGGPGFGGGGGAGAGGFGGGLGGLGLLAGLGVIAASTSDDNNALAPPVIASPAVPIAGPSPAN